MSGLSPAHRLRTKTSDLTDFFRGAGHTANQPRQPQKDATISGQPNLDVTSSDNEGATKKKITRIPLFGRSRRKSNHSTASSPFASSSLARGSSDVGEQSSRSPSLDRRPSGRLPIYTQAPPLPVPSKAPTSYLGSKFAARFAHSRSSKTPVNTHTESARSSALSPHATRTSSSESGSSGGSKTRSTTPRPAQPTITVSLSPDDVDQFQDLFTRHSPQGSTSDSFQTAKPLKQRTDDPGVAPSSSPPPSSRTRSPEQSIYRRGHTPASAIAAAVRDRQTSSTGNEHPLSTSSKSLRKNSVSDKTNAGYDERSTPRLADSRLSHPPLVPEKEKVLPPIVQRRPSVSLGSSHPPENASSTLRSRMKQPSTPARSKPPSMPLPLPPVPSTAPPEIPISPQSQTGRSPKIDSEPISQKAVVQRPRVHIVESVTDISTPLPSLPSISRSITNPTEVPITLASSFEGETFDIDTASVEELRQALKTRNRQYDELATYVLKATDAHVAEVLVLEKRIHALNKDVARRDTEIKGLKYMINDEELPQRSETLPPVISNHSHLFPAIGNADSDQDTQSSPARGPPRRRYYQSDSGAESHANSGAESLRASGASGTESATSMLRGKKLRPFILGETTHNIARTGSTRHSSKFPLGVGEHTVSEVSSLSNSMRSSINYTSPSPSSSTSSLLPPSPSVTMSSLSAIREGPPSTFRPLRYDSDQQEERRALHASYRTSTSSMTSSSTAASSANSANIKRSRPPSIAQVLETSPSMDDVLEKLRPFA